MDGSNPTENADLLTLSTDEIGNITEEQDTITVHYGNGLIKFPSKVSYGDINWTLNAFCEPNVLEELYKWRHQVYDPYLERMGLPSEYMRQVWFLRYDGQGNIRQAFRAPGTWIGALDAGSNNQAGGDILKISLPLVISKMIPLSTAELNG